jgi:hypothetical protein
LSVFFTGFFVSAVVSAGGCSGSVVSAVAAGSAGVAGVAGVAGIAAVPVVGSAGVAGVAGVAGTAGVAALAAPGPLVGWAARAAALVIKNAPASRVRVIIMKPSFRGFSGCGLSLDPGSNWR